MNGNVFRCQPCIIRQNTNNNNGCQQNYAKSSKQLTTIQRGFLCLHICQRPTACVTGGWGEQGSKTETVKAQKQLRKTRRVPAVRCTTVGWGHPISRKKQKSCSLGRLVGQLCAMIHYFNGSTKVGISSSRGTS